MNILDYINRINEIYGKDEPRITAQEPRNMAQGGIIGKPGGLVEPGVTHYATWKTRSGATVSDVQKGPFQHPVKNQTGKIVWRKKPIKRPGKTVDARVQEFYNDILNDYDKYTLETIKEGKVNKVKGMKDFIKDYKRPDGKPVKYNIISSWLSDNNKWPVTAQEIKKTIYNNAVTEANEGDKWLNKKTLANNIGMKNERELFNFTKYYKNIGGKLKELDSVEIKVSKNADKFFSNLDQPVESFFSSISKISKITRVDPSAVSGALKNYNFPVDTEIIKSLGSATVQGKVAGLDWRLDDFIDYYNNKSFMEPSTLKQLANVDKTAANIVQDAWRHTLQGGKDIEWIERPKLNKDGKVTSWLDAKFKYVGEDIDTPLNQRKIWTVGNQNPNKNIFNIDFVGRDAPEFKKQFQLTEDMFNFNNELVNIQLKARW